MISSRDHISVSGFRYSRSIDECGVVVIALAMDSEVSPLPFYLSRVVHRIEDAVDILFLDTLQS